MRKAMLILVVFLVLISVCSSVCEALDFSSFSLSADWKIKRRIFPRIFYLLVVNSNNNLTTPTGDELINPQ